MCVVARRFRTRRARLCLLLMSFKRHSCIVECVHNQSTENRPLEAFSVETPAVAPGVGAAGLEDHVTIAMPEHNCRLDPVRKVLCNKIAERKRGDRVWGQESRMRVAV